MCGVTGILSRAPHDWERCIAEMVAPLAHRGPDDAACWIDRDAGIALGHRRLAILDLSPAGRQPMVSRQGRFVLAFNGEIYNHAELRAALGAGDALGPLRGHSDTEILLAAMEAWGVADAIARCVGMFAIAVWDRERRLLYLARDRAGEKPLYYGWVGDSFVFGSELKALEASPGWSGGVDRTALDLLLRYGYVPAPRSIYAGISKLLPGTLLQVHSSGPVECEVFWSPRDVFEAGAARPFEGSEAEAADELDRLLRAAVRDQLVADVAVGAFFSGGIDSSAVVAIMQAESPGRVRTYTVGFDDPACDETGPARRIAEHLGTEHTELRVSGTDALALVPSLPTVYDEPFADPSQMPMMLIARCCRTQVKVCLSGDGGDELFGGYEHYRQVPRALRLAGRAPRWVRDGSASLLGAAAAPAAWLAAAPLAVREGNTPPLGRRLTSLAHRLRARSPEAAYHLSLSRWAGAPSLVLGADEAPGLIEPARWASLPEPAGMMMYQDLISYLPDDILVKVDRATMAVGLEARAPYLDHRVIEFVARLPLAMRLREGTGKWLLRQVLERYVPRHLTDRRKQGFGPPLRGWLRGPLREWGEDLLAPRRLSEQGFLRVGQVRRIWTEFQQGRLHWTGLLWAILMFQAWTQRSPARQHG